MSNRDPYSDSLFSTGHGAGASFVRKPIRDRFFDFGRNHCSPSQPACYLWIDSRIDSDPSRSRKLPGPVVGPKTNRKLQI